MVLLRPCRVFARRSRERGYVPQERPSESAETKEVARGDASKVEEGAADHGEGAEDDEGGSKGRALRRLLLSSSLDKKREGAAGQTALQVK